MTPYDPPYYYDRDGNQIGFEAWSRLFSTALYKIVAQSEIGPYYVSTVWIGVDHGFTLSGPPIIFETMVFGHAGGDGLGPDIECRRYATEAEARAGHDEIVTLILATTQYDVAERHGAPPGD